VSCAQRAAAPYVATPGSSRRTGRYVPGGSDHRPADDEYYDHDRTELFSQGDIFRDVPLAYPAVLGELEEDEDAGGEVLLGTITLDA